ncbi:MAG: hypothetical protein CR217_13220 [Beijerinckiaceae bacterium]|nr:MAG: hypothetical protein CR217_13220 [Beijerinckiaceae bacterium]
MPDAEFDIIPRQVGFLLRKGKALQLNLAGLSQDRKPAPCLITRDGIVTLSKQRPFRSWRGEAKALESLSLALSREALSRKTVEASKT